jgi:hypothetical protein
MRGYQNMDCPGIIDPGASERAGFDRAAAKTPLTLSTLRNALGWYTFP